MNSRTFPSASRNTTRSSRGIQQCLLLLLAALLLTSVAYGDETATLAEFFVSPQGNDEWSGTLDAPNADKTDGPFATLDRARRGLRDLKGTKRRLVLVRGGTYEQTQPLVFERKDGGSESMPATYRAYPDERVVISGGRRIHWDRTTRSGWEVELPDVKSGDWHFRQLFVGSERRFRPRMPALGHYRVGEEHEPTEDVAGRGFNRYGYASGQMSDSWRLWDQIEVIVFPRVGASRHFIKEIDTKEHIVTLKGATPSHQEWARISRRSRIVLDNVRHAFDEAGEWFLDTTSGTLRYKPTDDERSKEHRAYAPRLNTIVELRGDAKGKKYVDHIVFENVTFAHTTYPLPEEGQSNADADSNLPAAVTATAARNCYFRNCTFEHLGGWGLELGAGCKENTIDGCTFRDLGAGAIKLGAQKPGTGAPQKPKKKAHKLISSNHVIRNSLIAHGGRVHPAAVGIWIGASALNSIEHNEICDFYGGGISLGRKKGYLPSHAFRNDIANNLIHNIGQRVLSEIAGVRCIGMTIGTEIHHNRIETIASQESGGWGVNLEEGATGVVVHSNLIHDTSDGALHLREGKDNTVLNNIFANGGKHQLQLGADEPHHSLTVERNIFFWGSGNLLAGNWSGQNFKLKRNLYWCTGSKGVTFGGASLEQWQKTKFQDKGSVIADPGFANVDEGNFKVTKKSTLKKIGFKQLELNDVGREGDPAPKKPWPCLWPHGDE